MSSYFSSLPVLSVSVFLSSRYSRNPVERNPEKILSAGSFVNSREGDLQDSYKGNIQCFGKKYVFQLEKTVSRVLGQRVTNSIEQTKLTFTVRIQQLELLTRM